MKITILTLFPEFFAGVITGSVIGRACEQGILDIKVVNIRDYAPDKHHQVDDYPYGGGAGMLMKADVLSRAIRANCTERSHVVYLSPQGRVFSQPKAVKLAQQEELLLLCGHYEGIDERVLSLMDEEISLGDFILTGGELPAMVLTDAVARLVPGVLGAEASAEEESFSSGLLEYPHYTRPAEWEGQQVPYVLMSGHHENIRRWRLQQSLRRTLLKRPDLLLQRDYTEEEQMLLREIIFKRSTIDE